ncbi:MAG TPA: hypothetical protein VKG92_08620 [Flavobacteriales bacterium]|nr:hypothetical protein [Flavobacteriales bacterium]
MRAGRFILLLSVLALAATSQAQWGFRFIIPQFERIIKAPVWKQGSWGIGLDRDVSDRTSVGLDVFWDLQRLLGEGREVQTMYDGFDITYHEHTKVFGLQYRSQFFLSDEPEGYYLGTVIGIRQVRQSIEIYDTYSSNYYYQDPEDAGIRDIKEQSATTIPVGLRLGVRSELDGGYWDLYLGMAYQAGGNTAVCKAPYLDASGELSGAMLQFGLAYGIGW